MTVNGTTAVSTGANLTVELPNGTYTYTIHPPNGDASNITEGNVTVDGVPMDVLETLPGVDYAQGVLADPANDRLYVPNSTSDQLLILNDSSGQVVQTDPIGSYGDTPILAPDGRLVYVVNLESSNVSVVNVTTGNVSATLPTGSLPYYAALDPDNARIYVPDSNSNEVTVIDATNATVVGNVHVCGTPVTAVAEPNNQEVVVTCDGTGGPGYLDVINVTNDSVTSTIDLPSMLVEGGVYDATVGEVFLSDTVPGHNRTIVINATTNTVAGYISLPPADVPVVPALDPLNGMLYFPSTGNANVSVVDPLTNRYVTSIALPGHPSAVVFDPRTGDLWVDEYWGPGLALLNGHPTEVFLGFTGSGAQYPVTFTEAGLPPGTGWSATFGGTVNTSVTSQIGFSVPNGTYAYSFGPVAGYRPAPPAGNLTVNGVATMLFVAWQPVVYPVDFVESGLPNGTNWSVVFDDETYPTINASIQVMVGNGTYEYDVGAVPNFTTRTPSGLVFVNGSSVLVPVVFAPVSTYRVEFNESGLPLDASWTVWVNGTGGSRDWNGTSASLGGLLRNGTYAYEVIGPAPYLPTPDQGSFAVAGAGANFSVVFAEPPPPPPALGDVEGTVSPTQVTLTIGGTLVPTSEGRYRASETPGTYLIHANATGYVSYDTNVTVLENETSWANVTLVPLPTGHAATSSSGLPPEILWVAIATVAAAVVAIAAVVAVRRRPGPPPPE